MTDAEGRKKLRAEFTPAQLRQKAGVYLRKKDYYMAAFCRELASDFWMAAKLYQKVNEWDDAARCYRELGLTKKADEMNEMWYKTYKKW
jgi:hypothetical protein